MTINYKKNSNYVFLFLLQFVVFLFCLLNSYFQKESLFIGITYFLFQLLFVFIPGFFIKSFFVRNDKNYAFNIALSYTLGIFFVLLEYYVAQILNISSYSLYLSIIVFLLSIFCVVKNRTYEEIKTYDNCSYLVIFILTIVYVICFLALSLKNTSPVISGDTYYDKDFLYWVGNCISFMKGLPVQDYRLVGNKFCYHYFSSVFLAQSSFITKLDVLVLCMYYSSIIPCLLLVLSSYAFLTKFLKNRILTYIGLIAILLADGINGYVTAHLYFCPFGYDYAYSIGMVSIAYLFDIYKNDKYSIKEMMLSSIMIMLVTGLKGPVSMVILMAYAIIAFSLIINRRFKTGFICGGIWLFSFLVIMFCFVMNLSSETELSQGLSFVGILGGFDLNVGPMNLYVKLRDRLGFNDSCILMMISILLFIARQNYFAAIFAFVILIYLIISIYKHKKIDIAYIVFLSIYCFGALLNLTTHQDGNSQLYFLSSIIPYGIILGLYFVDNIKVKNVFLSLIVALLIIPNVYSFTKYAIFQKCIDGINTFNKTINEKIDKSHTINGHATLSDYNVSKWLENNTDEYDYIAVDCFEYENEKKHEVLGVLSKRFIWNDGKYSDYIKEIKRRNSIFEDKEVTDKDIDFLISENVKYLVKTPSKLINYDINKEKSDLVFEGNGYLIYKLK